MEIGFQGPDNQPTANMTTVGTAEDPQQALKATICEEINKEFSVGDVFESKDHLLDAVQAIASKHCFSVMKNSFKVVCRRHGEHKQKKGEPNQEGVVWRSGKSFKVGCPFSIGCNFVDIIPKKDRPVGQEKKNKLGTSDKVKVTAINGMHAAECQLNPEEKQQANGTEKQEA